MGGSSQFGTAEAVLDGTRYMVAMQLAREPLVRQVLRQTFQERAKINTQPTKKGKKVDQDHRVPLVRGVFVVFVGNTGPPQGLVGWGVVCMLSRGVSLTHPGFFTLVVRCFKQQLTKKLVQFFK